jgi:hypothetical protein
MVEQQIREPLGVDINKSGQLYELSQTICSRLIGFVASDLPSTVSGPASGPVCSSDRPPYDHFPGIIFQALEILTRQAARFVARIGHRRALRFPRTQDSY